MSVSLPGVEVTARVRVIPAVIGTRLTISAPETVIAGKSFPVSGRLTDEYGNPIPDATIELYSDTSKIGESRTGRDGGYVFNVVIEAPGEYTLKARFPGMAVPWEKLPIPIPPAGPPIRPPPIRLMYGGEYIIYQPSEATLTIEAPTIPPKREGLKLIAIGIAFGIGTILGAIFSAKR